MGRKEPSSTDDLLTGIHKIYKAREPPAWFLRLESQLKVESQLRESRELRKRLEEKYGSEEKGD